MALQITLLIAIVTLIAFYINMEARPLTSVVILLTGLLIGTGAFLPAIITIILLVAFHINMIMFRAIITVFKTGLAQVTR